MSIDHSHTIIRLTDVTFGYSALPVISHISLDIHRGDYVGIIGPNGSGKSTLLKVMLGLLKPATGSVQLFGTPIQSFSNWSKLGYVPQKAINFDPLFPVTVREVVEMGRYGTIGLLRGLTKKDDAIITRSLEQVDMLPFQNRLIGDLSSGQQQRVFIARALAGEPEVIFLDEPTVGVDVGTQEQFYALLRRLNQELGLTLILVSHDIDVIAGEVTELACSNQTLVYHGEPEEFVKGEYLQKLYGKNIRQILHDH